MKSDFSGIQTLAEEIKETFQEARTFQVWVSFYPYRGLKHTIRLRQGTIFIRLSDRMNGAPPEVYRALFVILFAKLFRYRIDAGWRRLYAEYAARLEQPAAASPPADLSRYQSAGRYYDLDPLFDVLNRDFFSGKLPKPHLGWSRNNSTTRLGFYDADRKLIVVSQNLDGRKVPAYVVRYILYHEMLHVAIPVERVNGRRRIHPPHFKALEQAYPDYERARQWLQKHFRKRGWRLF